MNTIEEALMHTIARLNSDLKQQVDRLESRLANMETRLAELEAGSPEHVLWNTRRWQIQAELNQQFSERIDATQDTLARHQERHHP